MARLQNELGAALVLLALFIAGASAQSSCSNVLISLSPCLNYITGNSSTPSSGCCTQLASVVKSNPECLCQVLGGGSSSLGISINQTRALALPGTCNVQTPSLSRCNAASPANSPAGSPESPTGSGTTVPSTDSNPSSDSSSTKLSFSLFFFLLFAASYVSTFTGR